MDNSVILTTPADQSHAHEAQSRIRDLSSKGAIDLFGQAVIETDDKGTPTIKDADEPALGIGTITGGLLGSVVGVLGGPAGLLLGFSAGTAAGAVGDAVASATELLPAVPAGRAQQAKELEDTAAGARAESETKLRARADELRTTIAEAKSDVDKKVDERSAEISGRWKQMRESVADGFESLRENVEARRADRAVARAERTAENAEFDAEAAVTFAVFALREAEYYVLAAAVARADAVAAEAAQER